MSYEAYIVTINEEDMMTRHTKLGIFGSYEEIEKHVNDTEIDYTLIKYGDLYLCIADLSDIKAGEVVCPEHGEIASLKLDFFPIKIED